MLAMNEQRTRSRRPSEKNYVFLQWPISLRHDKGIVKSFSCRAGEEVGKLAGCAAAARRLPGSLARTRNAVQAIESVASPRWSNGS
jgi:hypothetical protein